MKIVIDPLYFAVLSITVPNWFGKRSSQNILARIIHKKGEPRSTR